MRVGGRLELASAAAMNLAYCLVVAVFLWRMCPGLRVRVLTWLRNQVLVYERGRWVARWESLPPYLQEAAEVRGKRPGRRPSRAA